MFLDLEDYMLPCLNKKLLGVDCLGCGFQRAFLLLIKGDFVEAFKMYPAIYTLILFFGFVILQQFYTFKYGSKIVISLMITNILIITTSYIIKII